MIIVGLGNPSSEYRQTRHNLGFVVLDALAAKYQVVWKTEYGVQWTKIDDRLLVKPQEFMNVSGPTLAKFLAKKKIAGRPEHDLIVVHDDLDFPFGEIHEQVNRSAAGHNGVQSIIDTFETQDFRRLRIGIGQNQHLGVPAETYVLQSFTASEYEQLPAVIDRAVQCLDGIASTNP